MKHEPVDFFTRYFVVLFRERIQSRLHSSDPIRNVFYLVLILLFLNGFLFVFSIKDIWNVPKADQYEKPSLLFGINSEGNYEPIAEFYRFSRIVLTDEDLPGGWDNKVIRCFESTEDNNFRSHKGLDLRGIFRAAMVNLLAGRVKEGASTITQQVARLKFLNTERSFGRKIREAWLALLLEAVFDKKTLMHIYLNEIPLGHGTIGAGAAARFYFRKDLKDLSWGEAALLASLTTRPKEFSPLVNPNTSASKVRVVFKKLVENGILDVDTAEKEFSAFSEYYITLNRSPNDSAFSDRLNRFPYFTEYVRKNLSRYIPQTQLYEGGLKIYSTLNIQHQTQAEKALISGLKQQTQLSNQRAFTKIDAFEDSYGPIFQLLSDLNDVPEFKFKISRSYRTFNRAWQEDLRDELSVLNLISGTEGLGESIDLNYKTQATQDHLLPVEGALISIRPDTGYITSVVGGSGFRSDNQQIRAFQAYRQPGSAFKPLVYASSMEYYHQHPDDKKNVTAASLFDDSPLQYVLEDGDEWNPSNYSGEYSGFIRLRQALELSRNSVAVRLLEHTGLNNLLPNLERILQVENRNLPRDFSIALGSFEVSPYELARAYSVFASGGKQVFPLSVLYVEDENGNMIKDFRTEFETKERKRLVSSEVSYVITSMMEDVIKKGTGTGARSYGLTRPAAGKTGTTNNFRDAWFAGYTPELVAVVWVGYDTGTLSLGRGMSGAVVAAPIWGRFMANALSKERSKPFDFGDAKIVRKTICSISGKLPGSHCYQTEEEVFDSKTVPKEVCEDHKGMTGPEPSHEPSPQTTKKKKPNLFEGDEDVIR
ncbi:PBP1A family penicillin-binding protein [Leptospira langatensis]|uniref:peptidoglycan glycosyltransferase n=1 Tax=Leptospira langatensis TaxID=2484983 RepID=A0A5F1ZTN5_9LEPT|nr:PBP1A family penicillin-binding protein [Leptospira langatensis]TGK02584.1 PBP1A family penicillin-binding protein [Leptospira langatensis]TGL40216.1 PBP1A family penicillin-binding protein [Leptospira langatensis]